MLLESRIGAQHGLSLRAGALDDPGVVDGAHRFTFAELDATVNRLAHGLAQRGVRKGDMKWNSNTPTMSVDPESYEVQADGVVMEVPPAEKLPLARGYNLF